MKYPVLVWWLALAVCVSSNDQSFQVNLMDCLHLWIPFGDDSGNFGTLYIDAPPRIEDELQVKPPPLLMHLYYKTWMLMPDGDGHPRVAYLVEPPASNDTRKESLPIKVEFYESEFYDYVKPITPVLLSFCIIDNQVIHNEADSKVSDLGFNPSDDTKILVHGWMSNAMSDPIQSIREVYARAKNFNVFVIDWRDQADDIYYLNSARYTEQVGRAVAHLIDLLVQEKGANPKRIHLIGLGLGAHVMGYAGSFATNKVARITGLDPARHGFESMDSLGPGKHLNAADADFVDVIHTTVGTLGFVEPIGHADFYPNGGRSPQPGCTSWDASCSHWRSSKYYLESIYTYRRFYSAPCPAHEEAFVGNCSGSQILMGEAVPVTARGVYYLQTAGNYFALGKDPHIERIEMKVSF